MVSSWGGATTRYLLRSIKHSVVHTVRTYIHPHVQPTLVVEASYLFPTLINLCVPFLAPFPPPPRLRTFFCDRPPWLVGSRCNYTTPTTSHPQLSVRLIRVSSIRILAFESWPVCTSCLYIVHTYIHPSIHTYIHPHHYPIILGRTWRLTSLAPPFPGHNYLSPSLPPTIQTLLSPYSSSPVTTLLSRPVVFGLFPLWTPRPSSQPHTSSLLFNISPSASIPHTSRCLLAS